MDPRTTSLFSIDDSMFHANPVDDSMFHTNIIHSGCHDGEVSYKYCKTQALHHLLGLSDGLNDRSSFHKPSSSPAFQIAILHLCIGLDGKEAQKEEIKRTGLDLQGVSNGDPG